MPNRSNQPIAGEEVELLGGATAVIKRFERVIEHGDEWLFVVSLNKPCRQEFANVKSFINGMWLEHRLRPLLESTVPQFHQQQESRVHRMPPRPYWKRIPHYPAEWSAPHVILRRLPFVIPAYTFRALFVACIFAGWDLQSARSAWRETR